MNPEFVADIAPLTGSQTEIMRCIGISWNSWIKICAGLPIRLSVGRRLRDRLLAEAPESAGLRGRFSHIASGIEIRRRAREVNFLLPANTTDETSRSMPQLRSVGRALKMLSAKRSGLEVGVHP
ncbi:hypothetical protein [Sphingosinicella microcystinivorans]|uniref:hypothetical protein n=1 Tax=Sphingosinicella microcystinivorans TaxID=335406 RepID=UPI00135B1E16|nr:hypothetical protein [Sphingosinicella microcystinivorans]